MSFTYILCVAPGQAHAASAQGLTIAHMAWQIGSNLSLQRGNILTSMRSGLMMLGDALYDGSDGEAYLLAQEVCKECVVMGFDGVVCDFEQRHSRNLSRFIAECVQLFNRKKMGVYVSEKYAGSDGSTKIFIPTALSSGSLQNRLNEAVYRYGKDRIVLEIERIRRDIILPSPNSSGRNLTNLEFEKIVKIKGQNSFFSQEMCSRYFTYKDSDGQTHFVIFDDGHTIQKKANLALQLGITSGFVLYPEVQDFLTKLI